MMVMGYFARNEDSSACLSTYLGVERLLAYITTCLGQSQNFGEPASDLLGQALNYVEQRK